MFERKKIIVHTGPRLKGKNSQVYTDPHVRKNTGLYSAVLKKRPTDLRGRK